MDWDVETLAGIIKVVLLSTTQEVPECQKKKKEALGYEGHSRPQRPQEGLDLRERKSKPEAAIPYKEVNCAIIKE